MSEAAAEIRYEVDENGEIVGELSEVSESEPETPDAEPDETEVQGDDEDAEDAEPETGAEPEAASVMDEKALERRGQKLDAENTRHAKRIGEIMEDDATDLIPCPVCMDGIAGWVYPPDVIEPSEDQVSRVRQFAGLPDYSNFQTVTWAQECGECRGFGKVVTGSKVIGRETTGCLACNEAGWVNRRGVQAENGAAAAEPSKITGPTVYTTTEPDERIAALRAEGYFVAPPPQFSAG